jgi:hypothetical protein
MPKRGNSSGKCGYNEFRPHQGLDNRPLSGKWPDKNEPLAEGEKIVCHESLGGILRHYERVAAWLLISYRSRHGDRVFARDRQDGHYPAFHGERCVSPWSMGKETKNIQFWCKKLA